MKRITNHSTSTLLLLALMLSLFNLQTTSALAKSMLSSAPVCGSGDLTVEATLENARDLGSKGCLIVVQEFGNDSGKAILILTPTFAPPNYPDVTLVSATVGLSLAPRNYKGIPTFTRDSDGIVAITLDFDAISTNTTRRLKSS